VRIATAAGAAVEQRTMARHTGRSTIVLSETGALWVFVLTAVGLAAVDAWLIFGAPADDPDKSPLAVPVITFFVIVLIFAIVSTFMRRRLVEEMKAPVLTDAEITAAPAAALPPVSLALNVVTGKNLPEPSPWSAELLARSRQIFRHSVAMHRRLVWYLIVANCAFALVESGFGTDSPLPASLTFILALAAPLLGFVANARKSQNSLTYVVWLVLHAAWVGLTLYVAGASVVALAKLVYRREFHPAAAVPTILISAVLLGYILWLDRAIGRLRREVLQRPPLKLLFLWVFGPSARINSMFLALGALWRCLGPLQLLEGGVIVGFGSDIFRYLSGRSRQIIALTPEEVDEKISRFPQSPHRLWCLYATNMLLCGDQSWRHALTTLLRGTDLVLMDLCGFSRKNAGCIYEIRQLVDHIDVSRFLLLIDRTTDLDFLQELLKSAWDDMASNSPNRRPDCGPVRLFRLDEEYVDDKVSVAVAQGNAASILQLLCAGPTTAGTRS